MLRMGKNPKDQENSEHSTDRQDTTPYSPPPSYGSYGMDAQAKSGPESSARRALTDRETLARNIKEGTLSGFVGNGTTVTGETTFKAMLRIDGHLSGHISSIGGTLTVGTNGKVDANIEVAVAVIHGTVNGDIVATQRLEFGRAAKVYGNIQTQSLVIEQGAIFEGVCKMPQKVQKNHDQPLSTTNFQLGTADEASKTTDMPNVSDLAS